MKKILLSAALLTVTNLLFAQGKVGVNTIYPQGTFHVDGQKDNTPSNNNDSNYHYDDFIVLPDGRVGVGTINPAFKLDVKGNIANGGFDFILGNKDQTSRGNTGASRALVKIQNSTLVLNYANDFTGGVYSPGAVEFENQSYPSNQKPSLSVKGTQGNALQIADGSQGVGKILQSDATGKATWVSNIAIAPTILGNLGNGIDVDSTTPAGTYTGSSITLPANSKYLVTANFIMASKTGTSPQNSSFWLRTTFSDNPNSGDPSSDILTGKLLISGLLPGSSPYSILNGTVIIENKSSSPKTYYYNLFRNPYTVFNQATGVDRFGGEPYGEGALYAVPIN